MIRTPSQPKQKMKINLMITALLIGAGACQTPSSGSHNHASGEGSTRPVAALEQSVMAIHDSIMPQMSELMRLRKVISAKVAETNDRTVKQRGLQIRQQLSGADRAMMDWMHHYNRDTLATLEPEQATQYLRHQKRTIDRVSDQMRESIEAANKFTKP